MTNPAQGTEFRVKSVSLIRAIYRKLPLIARIRLTDFSANLMPL
ncbi:hypothetical protein SBA3_2220016 [Candidatus Sulfopaludibacter sp. SbA3]|nr:hypothetical protein SBA3_2220016 [Candidatus Sulfopaludibacter sp. SbA3]